MNDRTVDPEITFHDQTDTVEPLYGKRPDTEVPGYEAEFDPGEVERASAFMKDALSEQDAAEDSADLIEDPKPVFLEDVDPERMVIPLLINRTTARELFGVRPGESLDDALDRLARERQGE